MNKEIHNGVKTCNAKTRNDWRRWLEKNSQKEKSVWLIIYHKSADVRSVNYEEAVEEAICFGWIDSVAHKRDSESKYQFFSQRKPGSNWSKINKDRADKMMQQGKMTSTGLQLIERAKKTGTWDALVDVQNSVVPDDLQRALNKNKKALKHFMAFPPSSKRIILEWILNAKKTETRIKRIEETVRLASENLRANHYRQ